MKSKNIFIVLILLGIGAALWWFAKPALETSPLMKVAEAPSASRPAISSLKPPQVEAPKAAPAPMPKSDPLISGTPKPTSVAATQSEFKSQPDLKESVAQTIRIFQAQDFVAAFKFVYDPAGLGFVPTSDNVPPTAEEYAETVRQNPLALNRMSLLLQALQSMQNDAPEMNDDGTRATYKLNPPGRRLQQSGFCENEWGLVSSRGS